MTEPASATHPTRVEFSSHELTAVVEAEGARIASLRLRATDPAASAAPDPGAGRELLLVTPWSGTTDGAWAMPVSSHEWHRRYPGGWHVLLPRSGDPVTIDGVEQPFHGEAAWRHWRLEAVENGCDATVDLRTVPLRLTRRIRLDGDTLSVTQEVTSFGAAAVDFGWVEHPAFDGALFDGATLALGEEAPRAFVEPHATAFADLDAPVGACTVEAPAIARRLTLAWDAAVFPRLQLWQERRGSTGFPWWGSVDAIGIEPASQPFDFGGDRLGALTVAPGETLSSTLSLTVRRMPAA
ncbi:hypothetical protein SCB71_18335 [Herbiconiux sp. KACC 21604]|uniref:hypothetical protein n=1 Tax=unclassified Herbiconiux TaxID=2618217 RepID=UPI001490CAC6|nr:hypothetical protein [Herbiconiux sp. SALV-R1]QJU55019.1 hypothetical protein HL652_16280 [Herbiconiux sp. SALV-R1]WPO86154.1 hypothetical protein SCB71_18335 [Herbiconiux sp. KACC 21604]